MKLSHALSTSAVAALMITGAMMVPANAASGDRDGDGIPNRWEKTHGMNPRKAADARADFDKDGLVNLAEYRQGGSPRDEDTDDDGHDDGDEVRDGTRSTDLRDADTDDDGILDGDEDADEDGEANEDEDDDDADRCSGDLDGDGEADEDDDDLFGTIASFDSETGTLSVTSLAGYAVTSVVTADTEIELEEPEGFEGDFEDEGTTADLVAGAQVAELELDEDTGAFESVTVYYQP